MRPERRIVVDGVHWTVFEHVPEYDRRRTRTLIFDAAHVVRRIRDYPPNWIELDDAALLAVCNGK
jgi:hypothetical protein